MNHKSTRQLDPSPQLLAPPLFRLRGLVFDWLTLMAAELDLTDRSLYLAFDFYDIFLTTGNEANSRHQLYFFGLASLFIASKYEEIYPPSLKVFLLIAGLHHSSLHSFGRRPFECRFVYVVRRAPHRVVFCSSTQNGREVAPVFGF